MAELNWEQLSGKTPEAVYRALIDSFGGLVYTIVMNRLNRCGTREDVEDCVSDVFVELYSSLPRYSPENGEIGAFVRSIATRRAIDAFRRLSYRKRFTADADEETLAQTRSGDDTAAEAESRIMKKRLWEAVTSLGKPDSDIIIWQYFYNMKVRDIAEKLSMSADAVQKRSLRARERIREILKG
jgi:RNA polymerase sigma-70 factor (ECF subfamily)